MNVCSTVDWLARSGRAVVVAGAVVVVVVAVVLEFYTGQLQKKSNNGSKLLQVC